MITSDLLDQSRETTVTAPNLLPVVSVVGTEVSDGGRNVDAVNVVNILTGQHPNHQQEEEEKDSWWRHVRARRIVGLLQSPHD